jgi:anti-sigma factor RsiW
VSLEVDGELSAFERSLLSAHLDSCEPCRAFAAGVRGFTDRLRTAPPEPVPHPVTLPQRRHAPFRLLQVSAAALAVIAVGLGSLMSSLRSGSVIPSDRFAAPPTSAVLDGRQMTDLQRERIKVRIARESVPERNRRPGPLV